VRYLYFAFKKMPRKNKSFIDKKLSSTFSLSSNHNDFADFFDKGENNVHDLGSSTILDENGNGKNGKFSGAAIQQKRKDILNLCLLDDGYDYTQHLREVVPDFQNSSFSVSSLQKLGKVRDFAIVDKCIEREILEVLENIETIELSSEEAGGIGNLEDNFVSKAMQEEKSSYENTLPVLSSILSAERPLSLNLLILTENGNTTEVQASKLKSKLISSLDFEADRGNGVSFLDRCASLKITPVDKFISKFKENVAVALENDDNKTFANIEIPCLERKTSSNSPEIIEIQNEKRYSKVITLQEDLFSRGHVDTSISENWRWNIRRKGEDKSEKIHRKHAVKEGRREARLAKKKLRNSFKDFKS
jgi:hypothetical protein